MDTLSQFFTDHLILIYFLYGLAFFMTGFVVLLEASRSPALPLSYALPFLAAFGLIHGAHEWVEMLQLIGGRPATALEQLFRLVVLALSFALLAEFGFRLLAAQGRRLMRAGRWLMGIVFVAGVGLIWTGLKGQEGIYTALDAWCRYSLAVPGAILAAAGLRCQGRQFASQLSILSERGTSQRLDVCNDLSLVGLAFLLYGLPGQFFVGSSPLPPSTVVNSELFLEMFGFPVQLLRTVVACMVAVFTVRTLRIFEVERQRQVADLTSARQRTQRRLMEEIAKRDALRRDMLRQIVLAQEEERQHIARELHDQAGQSLTALSWGLATLQEMLPDGHKGSEEQVAELRQLVQGVMQELRQIVARLRPAVLDELGLVAALITYADECSARFPFEVDVQITGPRRRLSSETETMLYRVAQEALTNVAKHARARHVQLELDFGESLVVLSVLDNGVGMKEATVEQAALAGQGWGLAGISERIELLGGHLDISSAAGVGTRLTVYVPAARREGEYGADSLVAGGRPRGRACGPAFLAGEKVGTGSDRRGSGGGGGS